MNKRLMRMAAMVLFSAVAFSSMAEAGALFPAGTYQNNEYTLRVSADGTYRITRPMKGETQLYSSGFALHEGAGICTVRESEGNLWAVTTSGTGSCYSAAVRGDYLIIENFGRTVKGLGGVWVKK